MEALREANRPIESSPLEVTVPVSNPVQNGTFLDTSSPSNDERLQGRRSAFSVTPTRELNSGAEQEPEAHLSLHGPTPFPEPTLIGRHFVSETLENNVHNGNQQASIETSYVTSLPASEESRVSREDDPDVHFEWPLPPSEAARSPKATDLVYPHLPASETVYYAVRRVVRSLSSVLAVSELGQFFDNLTDTKLEELLEDPAKLQKAHDDAAKSNGYALSPMRSLRSRLVRLMEIVGEGSC
jgi:hypothetical protein